MGSISRFAGYVLAFIVLLSLVAWEGSPVWRPLDYQLFRAMAQPGTIEMADDLIIIDVPHVPAGKSGFNLVDFRGRLTQLLTKLDRMSDNYEIPRAVVLDLYFGNDERGLQPLLSAIDKLVDKKVRVYAVFDTMGLKGKNFESREAELALPLYDRLDGGYLHTRFVEKLGVITYPSHIFVPSADNTITRSITSLPLQLAMDLNDVEEPQDVREYVLPLGSKREVESHTYRFEPTADGVSELLQNGQPPPSSFNLNEKIILVASYDGDVEVQGQSGPEHVAWAIDDQRKHNENARMPLDRPGVILTIVLFAGLWTALIFALIFKYVKILQTRPWVIALLSMGIGVLFLAGVSAVFSSNGEVIPVGLPLISVLLSGLLAWHFSMRFLVTGIVEGGDKYDVFISYSRKDGDWVAKNLIEPLQKLRKEDGSPLKIFFDKDEIRIGEAFTAKYMWAIVDSRNFIPVFTENYYGYTSHGRNEMDLAYKRFVEKNITILPIAFSDDTVPVIYSGLNYVNVGEGRDAVNEFEAALAASPDT